MLKIRVYCSSGMVAVHFGRGSVVSAKRLKTLKPLSTSLRRASANHRAGKMLDQATFAVLILTMTRLRAAKRARQNVTKPSVCSKVTSASRKTVLLLQEGTEEFTNVDGLRYPFAGDRINARSTNSGRVLRREVLPTNEKPRFGRLLIRQITEVRRANGRCDGHGASDNQDAAAVVTVFPPLPGTYAPHRRCRRISHQLFGRDRDGA